MCSSLNSNHLSPDYPKSQEFVSATSHKTNLHNCKLKSLAKFMSNTVCFEPASFVFSHCFIVDFASFQVFRNVHVVVVVEVIAVGILLLSQTHVRV